MRNKNKALKGLVLACLVFVSAGCFGGDEAPQKVTLKWWGVQASEAEVRPIIDAYKQAYPAVTLTYTQKNINTYEKDLLNAFAAGSGPDVFEVHNSWVPKYLDKISAAPANTFNIANFKRDFLDCVSYDFMRGDKVYGSALSVDSLALYYNKDLLRSGGISIPPRTWSELADVTRKVTKIGANDVIQTYGLSFGLSSNINRSVDMMYLLMLQGRSGDWSTDKTRPVFLEERQVDDKSFSPSREAFNFYTSFALPSSSNYSWDSNAKNNLDMFAAGKLAMMYGYSSALPQILKKSPNLNFDIAFVPQPNLTDSKVNFASYFGQVVHKGSKFQKASWELIKIATNKSTLEKYYKTKRVPSSRVDLVDSQVGDTALGIFATSNLTAKTFYRPDQLKVDMAIGDAIDDIVLRGNSINEVFRVLSQKVSGLSNERY